MAYSTYIELVNYFKGLTVTVPDIKTVTVGSDEATLDEQNSRILYPHLRVDTPEILFRNEDEGMATRYTFRLYVLTNVPNRTNEQENTRLSDMEQIVGKLIRRLWVDADAGLFDLITGDNQGDAVRAWSGDNVFGWWFQVVIDLYTDECA